MIPLATPSRTTSRLQTRERSFVKWCAQSLPPPRQSASLFHPTSFPGTRAPSLFVEPANVRLSGSNLLRRPALPSPLAQPLGDLLQGCGCRINRCIGHRTFWHGSSALARASRSFAPVEPAVQASFEGRLENIPLRETAVPFVARPCSELLQQRHRAPEIESGRRQMPHSVRQLRQSISCSVGAVSNLGDVHRTITSACDTQRKQTIRAARCCVITH